MIKNIRRFVNYVFPKLDFSVRNDYIVINGNYNKILENRELKNIVDNLNSFGFKVYNNDGIIFINDRKRVRDNDDYFSYNKWSSPSRIKLGLEEPYKILIKEKCPDKIKFDSVTKLAMNKGNEYEEYVLKKLEEKYNVTKICVGIPSLKDKSLILKSYSAIENGDEIIYQPLLLNSELKIWGLPDFLVRYDIFKELFPYNTRQLNKLRLNCFGNYPYIVIDVKLSGCELLGDGFLSDKIKNRLNKYQVYMYKNIVDKIQGECDINCGFILGSKTVFRKTIYEGIKFLGAIKLDKITGLIYDRDIINVLNMIKEIRENEFEKLLKCDNYNPKKRRTGKYSCDEFSNSRNNLGFMNNLDGTINYNFTNIVNDLKNKTLVYIDFEAINCLLNLPIEESQKRIGENNNIICQIGVLYPENNEYKYKSFISESYHDKDIKNNCVNFIKFIKEIETKLNQEMFLISWGHFERSNYLELKTKYNLEDLNIVNLLGLVKTNKIFNDKVSLSLKNIIKILGRNYPNDFPETYNNLEIQDGGNAMTELYEYYRTKDESIKNNIEKYNKIDCLLMYRIVEWMRKY